MKVQVIGAGLIGGSIALAAAESGHQVQIVDLDQQQTEYAASVLGILPGRFDSDICFVGVPPHAVAGVISDQIRLNPNTIFIDVASVKTEVIQDVESVCGELLNYVPSHPMSGKESSGPEAAAFDLFQDRIWVITPNRYTSSEAVEKTNSLLKQFGAIVVEMSAQEHDQLVALTSHTPQVISSALAALTVTTSEESLLVSGNGLRDMTRLAASNSDLWTDILIANRRNVQLVVNRLIDELSNLNKLLSQENNLGVKQFIDKGRDAKLRLPGKHGEKPQMFEVVSIQIDDRPGALAEIFQLAQKLNINIEDVRIDHALGREIAIIELSVIPEVAQTMRSAFQEDGWKIRTAAE